MAADQVSPEILDLLQIVAPDGVIALSDIPTGHREAFWLFSATIICFPHNGRNSTAGDDWHGPRKD
ncbi:hypothetical protein FZ025_20275 [Xanthomonas hyacinthi]|uniref:Uncharacterized protein n=1 Tax=Xanthomonas hyacinthi TaxID=56455 RepID=A0A2S7EMX9_9XANT|nr:hypothetical protein [Xanthomonas hyacinthi]KLD73883.1 hypothetical protein Y886_35580 [Xanthomonas hyacinthi DSM 19077]PPU92133.1 hypothetical protein XhyaCFBP1156_21135 [Xanthomonas hyacinthi]QGY78851.1 hypothetical protein FZ025_20275 [Xanthomonas hyacinthi]